MVSGHYWDAYPVPPGGRKLISPPKDHNGRGFEFCLGDTFVGDALPVLCSRMRTALQ